MDGTVDRQRTHFGAFLREVGDELAADRVGRGPSMPLVPAEWRRLDRDTPSMPGESLRGLVARACQRNTIPNSWGILQYLGLAHRNRVLVSEDDRLDPEELAFALGVAGQEVRSRRYEPVARGRVSFYGLELNPDRINTRVRRFSPATFRDPKRRFHRAFWELKDIPFCLVGWDMLQDTCFCEGNGVVQGWTRTLNRVEECDRCGDPLHSLESFPVPPAMIPALSLLRAIVDPEPAEREAAALHLPEELRQADRTRLLRIIVLMARAFDPESESQPFDDPAGRLNGLHLACNAISRWPAGLDAVQWHDGATKKAIAEIHKQWSAVAEKGGGQAAPASASANAKKGETKIANLVGLRPAYELARLSPEVMLAAWDNKLLTQHQRKHGQRTLPAFDVAEVLAFASAWHDRIEPDALSSRLGLPYYGLEQVVALGILMADAPALPKTGPHFSSQAVSKFLDAMAAQAGADRTNPTPLKKVMESIGGRPKPWGPVLDLLHRGEIDFQLADGMSLADGISIGAADANRVRSLTFNRSDHAGFRFRPRMVKRDALELLNISVEGDRLLVRLKTQGVNPKTFALWDVEDRAAIIMSVPELAARLNINCFSAYQRARRSKATEIIPGGWDRTRLLQLR